MFELLNKAMENSLIWAVLAIITVISLLFTVYTYVTNKKRKLFSVSCASYELLKQGQSEIEKVSIMFDDQPINNLTISNYAIWNSGNTLINGTDIVDTQRLRLISDDETKFLEAKIVSEVETSNKFRIIEQLDNEILLDFDYVDKNEGIVIQVIHTGEKDSINAQCKIKGGKPIKTYTFSQKKRNTNTAQKKLIKLFFPIYLIVVMFLFFALSTISTIGIMFRDVTKEVIIVGWEEIYFMCISSWIMTIMLGSLAYKLIRRILLVGIPAKLKVYTDTAYTK